MLPLRATADTPVGLPIVLAAVLTTSVVEFRPLPSAFTARTWNVYPVPARRPVTVWLVTPAPPEMFCQSSKSKLASLRFWRYW